jgi:hypothetical protein
MNLKVIYNITYDLWIFFICAFLLFNLVYCGLFFLRVSHNHKISKNVKLIADRAYIFQSFYNDVQELYFDLSRLKSN